MRWRFRSNTIQKNRDSALDQLLILIKNSSYNGFYHTQADNKPEEQVSVSFFCALNVEKGLCECCLKNVGKYLRKSCPKQQEGVAWDFYPLLQCMVRYSAARKIFSVLDDWAWYHSGDRLSVKTKAAGGDVLRKYAANTIHYDGDEHALYMDVMCTPDLTKEDCIKCLS
ncbi:putative Gnk2-like domain-containing protein [Helianthus anomalus]